MACTFVEARFCIEPAAHEWRAVFCFRNAAVVPPVGAGGAPAVAKVVHTVYGPPSLLSKGKEVTGWSELLR